MEQNFRMIDVGEKNITRRRAIATGKIKVCEKTFRMILQGQSPKGNILSIAEVAGIMAAKNTWQTLPLCHPLILDSIRLSYELNSDENVVTAFCEVICHGKTGVEMEALVGVNTCLLTIYDLAKAVDPEIEIFDIYLKSKEGGKSGFWVHPKDNLNSLNPNKDYQSQTINIQDSAQTKKVPDLKNKKIGVITLSDRASGYKKSETDYPDKSGPLLIDHFKNLGAEIHFQKIIPDLKNELKEVIQYSIHQKLDVLALTGGTGISDTDITPDTIKEFFNYKELTGFGELQRQYGSKYTKLSWLSRSSAFVVDGLLIVLFPGSPKAVSQGLEAIGDLFPHALKMIKGESHS